MFLQLKSKFFLCAFFGMLALLTVLQTGIFSTPTHAKQLKTLLQLSGDTDGVLVTDPNGAILFEKNADKKLIPASILKILTSLAALHFMGPDYRFSTEFYLDKNNNLKIKGYGDPLLISEILAEITEALAEKVTAIEDLVLDDSYFLKPVIIPGVTPSYQPYDAPNGALCVNFNTVYFRRSPKKTFVSAEPQTPLLPFVLPHVRSSALKQERIILSHKKNEGTLYAGHLFRYFLNKNGIKTNGTIRVGRVQKNADQLIFRYHSRFSLDQIIAKLLKYSNNFIANQLLITIGAGLYNPPGTLEKGVRAVSDFLKKELETDDLFYVEGSGISRKNRVSARTMIRVLDKFEPYHHLLRKKGPIYYKSGNLKGVSTRAGYIKNEKGKLYRFAVLNNTSGKSAEIMLEEIRSLVLSQQE